MINKRFRYPLSFCQVGSHSSSPQTRRSSQCIFPKWKLISVINVTIKILCHLPQCMLYTAFVSEVNMMGALIRKIHPRKNHMVSPAFVVVPRYFYQNIKLLVARRVSCIEHTNFSAMIASFLRFHCSSEVFVL